MYILSSDRFLTCISGPSHTLSRRPGTAPAPVPNRTRATQIPTTTYQYLCTQALIQVWLAINTLCCCCSMPGSLDSPLLAPFPTVLCHKDRFNIQRCILSSDSSLSTLFLAVLAVVRNLDVLDNVSTGQQSLPSCHPFFSCFSQAEMINPRTIRRDSYW